MAKSIGQSVVGVIRFPGTNCDRDVFEAVAKLGGEPRWLWHGDLFDHKEYSALILPGGFSYGDYLRSGALAARATAMKSVREAASYGTPILGICNGFQILCEARLLPGALSRNQGLRFIDEWVDLKVVGGLSRFGQNAKAQAASGLRIPIAHADGRYTVSIDEAKRLEDRGQVWLRYKVNPNGSVADIAGVTNEAGNVSGLMPHPERALETWMGSSDGRALLDLWS